MKTPIASLLLSVSVAGLLGVAPASGQTSKTGPSPRPAAAQSKPAAAAPMARILWLEPIPGRDQQKDDLPVYRRIPASDTHLRDYERYIDTEAARFARRLVYRAAERYGVDPLLREPVLPVVVREQGNHAEYGLAIQTPAGNEGHPKLPYVILDPSPQYLGDTILHETGHLVHTLAVAGRRGGASWSAFPHTTFAVSDRITALAEGYGIHLEAMWGHFGNDPAKQAYYHRLSPSFESGKGRKEEYFSPLDDLLNFAQVWARYQSVRDGMPAFEGHVYPGDYARSQMDPARDRARLKNPNAMLASEGVAASVMFWISSALAEQGGAKPGAGLDQPALVDAEMTLLQAIAAMPAPADVRPDLLDFIEAFSKAGLRARDIAIARFVDITRGVTARPAIRASWQTLYENSILLNLGDAKAQIAEMDAGRAAIVERAQADMSSLRAGVGPVLPVRATDATFQLKALGAARPIEFDLNAMSAADLALLTKVDREIAARIERERERAPFASLADFTARTTLTLPQIGLAPVDASERPGTSSR